MILKLMIMKFNGFRLKLIRSFIELLNLENLKKAKIYYKIEKSNLHLKNKQIREITLFYGCQVRSQIKSARMNGAVYDERPICFRHSFHFNEVKN
ncbi:hypothetical protein BpHYR1_031789 [Brachionus plicatilis]|uniref:Uncharacterized protein n=1 Tax=Brachionus plicatilis TaxID=10195 RepID=A0A3M7PRP9_BRAPC|nr:hypothetical protein BpHYR1_031789 [Brachionus plicatilis]